MREKMKPYLALAERLFADPAHETTWLAEAVTLPPFTDALLRQLVAHADHLALAQPRRGWALLAVATAAAQAQTVAPFLQAKAAWYLARSANEWVQPQRVAAALDQAQPIFEKQQATGWVAACQWQQNALPWTRPDFFAAATALALALTEMEKHPDLSEFVPHCRLSLAYAYLLINAYEDAISLIRQSMAYFETHQDPLNLARCWFVEAACRRRQNDFVQARLLVEQALDCFTEMQATADLARTQCQMMLVYWLGEGDYAAAEQVLKKALAHFAALDLPLWTAQALNFLAQLYNNNGHLAEAEIALHQARTILLIYDLPGLLGDSYLDGANGYIQKGEYHRTEAELRQAKQFYERANASMGQTTVLMTQGIVAIQLGRYHQGLTQLEEAHRRFQEFNIPGRLASCELALAEALRLLNQPESAHSYLDQAVLNSQHAHQVELAFSLNIARANLFIHTGQIETAIALLRDNLELANQHDNGIVQALLHRALGEALCKNQQLDEAAPYFRLAEERFIQIGMPLEEGVCHLRWGQYYQKTGQFAAARLAWEHAIALCQNASPDVTWQAHAGLASLAEQNGQYETALTQYEAMIHLLAQLRESLHQATLSGTFSGRPGQSVSRAIHLAITQERHEQSLKFIEASKAITLAQRLHSPALPLVHQRATQANPLATLAGEIRALQEQVRQQSINPSPILRGNLRHLQDILKQKALDYDNLINEVERMMLAGEPVGLSTHRFYLPHFQQVAQKKLGDNWVAIDYYLDKERIYGVIITSTICEAWQKTIFGDEALALKMVTKANPDHIGFAESDFKILADLLLPPQVQQRLRPDTTLLIVPHRALHRIPWAALWLDTVHAPLVTTCIPVIVPSLNSLIILWQRAQPEPFQLGEGILIAVSEFQDRHMPLAAVHEEAQALQGLLEGQIEERRDAAATWSNLLQLAQDGGLKPYSWLHIASHAFYDSYTGRLSGVALYDQDIWIDELWQCAPFPPLVTLSVCSGNRGHVHEGDEQVGLTVTCLVAGAQTVISSLWPITDKTTPELMLNFYRFITQGKPLAVALALAQRAAWQQGEHVNHWSSFCCIGQP